MKNILLAVIALLIGLGIGLAYSWLIAPVEYVDASPAMLRDDFKDQYRIVIAASYASSHDLARARARLDLLNDADPVGALSAQAQRMISANQADGNVQILAQLATDLQKGSVSIPLTSTPFATATSTALVVATASTKIAGAQTATPDASMPTLGATSEIPPPPFVIPALTITPRPTFTAVPKPGAPFVLIGQDPVCDPGIQSGLLQFNLIDSRRKPVPGIEIIVTSVAGEDHLFTGFKPELGNGYADFVMAENTSYSIRVVEGGTFITNISAPTCTDPNGKAYLGGLALAFQQR